MDSLTVTDEASTSWAPAVDDTKNEVLLLLHELQHDKTYRMTCTQPRLRLARASSQTDQSLRCAL